MDSYGELKKGSPPAPFFQFFAFSAEVSLEGAPFYLKIPLLMKSSLT